MQGTLGLAARELVAALAKGEDLRGDAREVSPALPAPPCLLKPWERPAGSAFEGSVP